MNIGELKQILEGLDEDIEIGLDSDDTVIPGFATAIVTTVEGATYIVFSGDNYCEKISHAEEIL